MKSFRLMQDWQAVSVEDRWHIEEDLVWALGQEGVEGTRMSWIPPSKVSHWQLIIETSWCSVKAMRSTRETLQHAMARVSIQTPPNAISLLPPIQG